LERCTEGQTNEEADLIIVKNAVFWDVAPCKYSINRRFGGATFNTEKENIAILPAEKKKSLALFGN
jgi:hypothetical protein